METRTFTITASAVLLRRIERFLALLHYNSGFGHSGLFAMPLVRRFPKKPNSEFANFVNTAEKTLLRGTMQNITGRIANMLKPLVIYHADCTDGFAAAFSCWLKLGG